MKEYILKVYNPSTKSTEEVKTTKEIYDAYKRTEWSIKYSDQSFYDHQIQMSYLSGVDDISLQFVSDEPNPHQICELAETLKDLQEAISKLREGDVKIIYAIYVEGKSEAEYAKESGIAQQTVHKKKKRILKFLKNFLKNGC